MSTPLFFFCNIFSFWIASVEGVQQPLGPLLFCLSIFSLGQQFTSVLNSLLTIKLSKTNLVAVGY